MPLKIYLIATSLVPLVNSTGFGVSFCSETIGPESYTRRYKTSLLLQASLSATTALQGEKDPQANRSIFFEKAIDRNIAGSS